MGGKITSNKKKLSSIMKQWKELKSKRPDAVILFSSGDFYETYNQDAKDCADILGIELTWSDNESFHNNETYDGATASFAFPYLDKYLPILVRAGKRVAICTMLEAPKKQKRTISELVNTIKK